MEDYDIIRQLLDLSETIGEGLEYISRQLDTGRYEETVALFQDVIQAFISIQMAMEPYLNRLPSSGIISLNKEFQNVLECIVTSYEKSNWNMIRQTMHQRLIPIYHDWKDELIRIFRSLIAS